MLIPVNQVPPGPFGFGSPPDLTRVSVSSFDIRVETGDVLAWTVSTVGSIHGLAGSSAGYSGGQKISRTPGNDWSGDAFASQSDYYFRTFVDVNPVADVPEPGSAAIFGVFVLGACMSKCFRKGLSAD